jgi:hypothetical protein
VTFLDSDDAYLPHRLAATVEAAQHGGIDLLLSSFRTVKGDRSLSSTNPDALLSGWQLELALMAYGIFIAGSAITVRRAALKRAGGFDPDIRRMQDREMLLRMSRYGGALLRSTVDWIKYPSPDSISGPRDGYVASLGAMLEPHPDMARRHRDLIAYHVARHVITELFRGRWWGVHGALRENRRAPMLGFTLRELRKSYGSGGTRRRGLVAALRRLGDEQWGSVMSEMHPHGPWSRDTLPHPRAA